MDNSNSGCQVLSPAKSEVFTSSIEHCQSQYAGLQHNSIRTKSWSQNEMKESPEDKKEGTVAEELLEKANTVHKLKIFLDSLKLPSPDQTFLKEEDATVCWLRYTFSGDAQVRRQRKHSQRCTP